MPKTKLCVALLPQGSSLSRRGFSHMWWQENLLIFVSTTVFVASQILVPFLYHLDCYLHNSMSNTLCTCPRCSMLCDCAKTHNLGTIILFFCFPLWCIVIRAPVWWLSCFSCLQSSSRNNLYLFDNCRHPRRLMITTNVFMYDKHPLGMTPIDDCHMSPWNEPRLSLPVRILLGWPLPLHSCMTNIPPVKTPTGIVRRLYGTNLNSHYW